MVSNTIKTVKKKILQKLAHLNYTIHLLYHSFGKYVSHQILLHLHVFWEREQTEVRSRYRINTRMIMPQLRKEKQNKKLRLTDFEVRKYMTL